MHEVTVRRYAALSVVLMILFVASAADVHAQGWVTDADAAVLRWFTDHRSGDITRIAEVLNQLGSPVGSALVALVVAGVLARSASGRPAALLVVGSAAAVGVAVVVAKAAVHRARPPAATELIVETDASFPSGHVTGAAVLYGVVALVLVHRARTRRLGAGIITVAVLAVAATAGARLYLGVHWFSDVVGAFLLGGSLLLLAAAAHRTFIEDASDAAETGGGRVVRVRNRRWLTRTDRRRAPAPRPVPPAP